MKKCTGWKWRLQNAIQWRLYYSGSTSNKGPKYGGFSGKFYKKCVKSLSRIYTRYIFQPITIQKISLTALHTSYTVLISKKKNDTRLHEFRPISWQWGLEIKVLEHLTWMTMMRLVLADKLTIKLWCRTSEVHFSSEAGLLRGCNYQGRSIDVLAGGGLLIKLPYDFRICLPST